MEVGSDDGGKLDLDSVKQQDEIVHLHQSMASEEALLL